MQHPPPPPRWLWFLAVATLSALASLTIAASHGPPPGLPESPEPVRAIRPGATLAAPLDPSPAFDRRCLICQQPLT